ncbi:YihA family ribosome biogenesis GTP-binding protein [Candidatus Pantoea edessiphila]|uniref:Probable GTP-binding protein EngB n=1 Tax=Candidatus Pantoea edessiphila TaxID=2044610 RepID=A0A2P5SXJ9_9GAMM|nr:ribosome biogenesis GTP-binding protein YihA/YsxC [Candidatus Pantoea edessiphila]MBK4775717.1 ribosome biogenesis GTP-binding protein YsxC [Pantoea sp. Edef]PPI87055.1 YihA family ribosome biogenesis GTP-binding protein [Candidatus Pantoea edessiphila]
MFKLNYHNTRFIISAPSINYLPDDRYNIQVAFIGRSNSGKSSLLNRLTHQKHLARTSKTPGCTKLINLFEIVQNKYLVDLPGYGYAKVFRKNQKQWQYTLIEYIKINKNLKGLLLLLDINCILNDFDKFIIQLANQQNISLLVLLTKADKLNFSTRKMRLDIMNKNLSNFNTVDIEVEIVSSIKNIGIENVYQKLNIWFKG